MHLRQFGDLPHSEALLVGIGENAGVVDVGDGYAVTFKVESHNHPSYVEPYQGAATGVGGIVRDILTMGARPIAVMDSLRFGRADAPDTARVLPGVVAGVGGYGNCLGLPNIGGELLFDDCYAGNPLVNALCVGVMRHEDVRLAKAEGVGNKVILFGARTGGDGIGGVSVLASRDLRRGRPGQAARACRWATRSPRSCSSRRAWRSSPQDLVTGIQDLGGAGLSCATSELASAGTGGMHVDLDTVPLRDSTLTPAEILMSESQERMCAIVEPGKVERSSPSAASGTCWPPSSVRSPTATGSPSTGTASGSSTSRRAPSPTRARSTSGRCRARPTSTRCRPTTRRACRGRRPPAELQAHWLAVVSSPDGADKSWVTEQYDRYVRGNTVLAQPEDAGVVRIDEETHRGIALALDGNARFARLDPYAGAQLNLAEAYRNVAVTGAKPLAVTNCLNFGSPEDPEVMWQFAEAVRGLADGCRELGLPVTGGNVSLYNQTGDVAINPTPVIGVLGVHEDVRRRVPTGWRTAGETVLLLGETRPEFGGSAWASVVHGHLGGRPPARGPGGRARPGRAARRAGRGGPGQLRARPGRRRPGAGAHRVRAALRRRRAAALDGDPFTALFSESAARAVVTTSDPGGVKDTAQRAGVPVTELGTTGGDALVVDGLLDLPLAELRAAWSATLPALFGRPEAPVGTVPAGTVPTS